MGKCEDCNDNCNAALCVILPPLAVFKVKGCADEFWKCVILTMLAWIPGMIYAVCVTAEASSSSDT